MFESGQPTKLSEETVKKLSEFLGVPLMAEFSPVMPVPTEGLHESLNAVHGFCPNCQCPSNVPYVVGARLFYLPSRTVASPSGGVRCTQCGEVLEMKCPSCGAPLNDGACCAVCGSSYVTSSIDDGIDMVAYARLRREEILQLRELK
jgi:hypothetical protein